MKTPFTTSPFHFAGGIVLPLLLLPVPTTAQSAWATLDELNVLGGFVQGAAIATAPPATVFVVHDEWDSLTWDHRGRVTRKSIDGGATWAESNRDLAPYTEFLNGTLVVNSVGHLFLVGVNNGNVMPGPGAYRWLVQRSVNEGASWEIVDDWQRTPSYYSRAMAIAVDDADNLYVSGEGKRDDDSGVWSFVRRSADGGQTWELVDEWRGPVDIDARSARWITASPSGIFVAGYTVTSWGNTSIYVRRSNDRGNTWETTAYFPLGATGVVEEQLADIKSDANGTLYGLFWQYITDGSSPSRLYFRRSTDGGVNWETFPHLPYDVWGSTWILAVGQQGRLIASGRMKDNKGWPVLASDDRGSSWTLSDDFQGVGIEGIQIKCNQAGDFFAIARKVVRDGGRVGDDLVIRKLAAPGAPRIRLSVEPSTLRLSWPGAFSGFIPQSTASLGSDINWLDLEATPVLEGEKWVVTVDPQTEEARFFRLRKP